MGSRGCCLWGLCAPSTGPHAHPAPLAAGLPRADSSAGGTTSVGAGPTEVHAASRRACSVSRPTGPAEQTGITANAQGDVG